MHRSSEIGNNRTQKGHKNGHPRSHNEPSRHLFATLYSSPPNQSGADSVPREARLAVDGPSRTAVAHLRPAHRPRANRTDCGRYQLRLIALQPLRSAAGDSMHRAQLVRRQHGRHLGASAPARSPASAASSARATVSTSTTSWTSSEPLRSWSDSASPVCCTGRPPSPC
jgi:hypothetical protein